MAQTDIRQALVSYLSALPGLVERLRGGISPVRHRMGQALPRLRYTITGHQRARSADGPCGQGVAAVQLELMAATYDEAVALTWLVVGTKADPRLDGYHGPMGDYHCDEARVDDWSDEWDEPVDGSDEWIYRERLDCMITYTEPGA